MSSIKHVCVKWTYILRHIGHSQISYISLCLCLCQVYSFKSKLFYLFKKAIFTGCKCTCMYYLHGRVFKYIWLWRKVFHGHLVYSSLAGTLGCINGATEHGSACAKKVGTATTMEPGFMAHVPAANGTRLHFCRLIIYTSVFYWGRPDTSVCDR